MHDVALWRTTLLGSKRLVYIAYPKFRHLKNDEFSHSADDIEAKTNYMSVLHCLPMTSNIKLGGTMIIIYACYL